MEKEIEFEVSPIRRCLHDVMSEILLTTYPTTKKEMKKEGAGAPCLLDLPKVYLVMHSDWEKNVEDCIRDEQDDSIKEKMKRSGNDVIKYIRLYYEAKFQNETQLFLEDTIDMLFEHFPEWHREFMNLRTMEAAPETRNPLVEMLEPLIVQMRKLRGRVYSFVLENEKWINGLPMISDHWLIRCEPDAKKTIAVFDHFKSEWIRELKMIIDTKKLKELSGGGETDVRRKKRIREILALYQRIFNGTQKIYFSHLIEEYYETDYLNFPITRNFLSSMKYGASDCFNLEAVLCFLFCRQVTFSKFLGRLVKGQESFFDDIYAAMVHRSAKVRALFEYGIDLKAVADSQGWTLLGRAQPQKVKIYKHSLTNLKNLLILYEIIGPKNRCKCIDYLLEFYLLILGETKLPYFSYDQRQCILSEFLKKTGMEKKDLAKLFDTSVQSVYRKCNDGTLYTKPIFSVYWMAVTGFTYDYLHGDTTLKFYGRDSTGQNKNHYLKTVVFSQEASEGILQVAKDYIAFKNDLTKKDSPYLAYRHPLWSKVDQEIDRRINKIVDLLARIRKAAGHSINGKNNDIIYGQFKSNARKQEKQEDMVDPLQAERYQSFLTCMDAIVDLLKKEKEKKFPAATKKEPSDEAPE